MHTIEEMHAIEHGGPKKILIKCMDNKSIRECGGGRGTENCHVLEIFQIFFLS